MRSFRRGIYVETGYVVPGARTRLAPRLRFSADARPIAQAIFLNLAVEAVAAHPQHPHGLKHSLTINASSSALRSISSIVAPGADGERSSPPSAPRPSCKPQGRCSGSSSSSSQSTSAR